MFHLCISAGLKLCFIQADTLVSSDGSWIIESSGGNFTEDGKGVTIQSDIKTAVTVVNMAVRGRQLK